MILWDWLFLFVPTFSSYMASGPSVGGFTQDFPEQSDVEDNKLGTMFTAVSAVLHNEDNTLIRLRTLSRTRTIVTYLPVKSSKPVQHKVQCAIPCINPLDSNGQERSLEPLSFERSRWLPFQYLNPLTSALFFMLLLLYPVCSAFSLQGRVVVPGPSPSQSSGL